jgi:hypothetical protein
MVFPICKEGRTESCRPERLSWSLSQRTRPSTAAQLFQAIGELEKFEISFKIEARKRILPQAYT